MSGEETTLTESGIVKDAVSKKDFLEWFWKSGEVERKETVDEKEKAVSA